VPILTLVGLILSIIKIGLDIVIYLKSHPDTPAQLRAVVDHAIPQFEETYRELSEWERTHDPEAP
jgi:hypothetical protein